MTDSHGPRKGSHDSAPAYACFQAADGDPELALVLALRLIRRGMIRVDKHGVHHGRLPAELRAAA